VNCNLRKLIFVDGGVIVYRLRLRAEAGAGGCGRGRSESKLAM